MCEINTLHTFNKNELQLNNTIKYTVALSTVLVTADDGIKASIGWA